jgi:hypothetical protein
MAPSWHVIEDNRRESPLLVLLLLILLPTSREEMQGATGYSSTLFS